MDERISIIDYVRSFNDFYHLSLSNRNYGLFSGIAHGDLCRYTKDLLDALTVFRNRFEEGKPHILKDISDLELMLSIPELTNDYSSEDVEQLKSLVKKMKSTYQALCNFVKEQDFNRL